MKKITGVIALVAALCTGVDAVSAETMVFTAWGGTTQDAQKEYWADTFTEKTGVKVLQDGPTDYGKIKAMIESGKVSWDVVDTEGEYAVQAGQQGLLEKLDFSVIDKKNLDPRFVTDYAVGSFYFSWVIGCNEQAAGKCPESWAEFFDTKEFPGQRTLYKWAAPGVLEAALLADGVDPDGLYPLDLDRAFAKLDTIKNDIVWWTTGAQSQQLLASGEAPYGSFWNGRLTALQQTGVPVKIIWNQNFTSADLLVVPKGAAHKEIAMQFIANATSPKAQADFAAKTGYAPINLESPDLMDPDIRATLPDLRQETQVNADLNYWAGHREEISKRWYEWQVK